MTAEDFDAQPTRPWAWLADLRASADSAAGCHTQPHPRPAAVRQLPPPEGALRRGGSRRRGLRVRFEILFVEEDLFADEPAELTSDDRAWIAEQQAWRREQLEMIFEED